MEEHKSGKDVAVVTIPLNPMQTSNHSKIDIVISPRAEAATSSSSSSKILMPFELLTNNGASQPHSHPIPQASPSSPHAHPWRPPQVLLIKKVTAEFLGTFVLMFTVLSTIVADEQHGGVEGLLGVAASAGLAVMVLVLSIVHISGCHLNPAVSIAMAVFGHLPRPQLLPYMAAQVMGSIGASFLVKAIFRPVSLAGIATVPKVGTVEAFFLEFVITFVLLFVIAALATDPHAVKELIAVAVGAAIMMNALVAGPSTGASMNPARTIGPAIVTGIYTQIWVYMVATILGAVAGTGAYLAIKL